jgi:hypothetical protein
MRRQARKALSALVYILGVIVFFEASARLALSVAWFRARVQGQDDASTRHRWLAAHRTNRQLAYGFDVHHPMRGWALRPGIRDLRVFGDRVLNSNSLGLRGRQERPYENPAGVRRVVVLGDSFTFGEDVSDDETFCQRLEQLLPGTEVLNLGVHGYGHDQMLLYLREEGVKYRPDLVLLGFVHADMERNLQGFRDYAKPRFVLRGGRLELRGVPVPPPAEILQREAYRSKLVDLWTILRGAAEWRSGVTERRMQTLTLAILDEIARESHAAGAVPAFAYLPVWGEAIKTDMSMTRQERFFFGYCRERGIQSMYLQRFFLKRLRAGVELRRFGHWGAEEHRAAAEGIAAYIVEKDLLSPVRAAQGAALRYPPQRGVEGDADAQDQQEGE